MARINTYQQDQNLSKSDKFLGSDSGGSTRNFSIESVSDFFKETNSGGVVGQFVWQYVNTEIKSGELQAVFSSGSTFASLTNIKVSKYTKGDGNSKQNILSNFVGKDVLLVETSDQDNHAVYNIQSISVINDGNGNATDNYDISLLYQNKGNGSLTLNKHYAFVVFGGGADKNTELTFTSSSFATSSGNLLTDTISGSAMPYVIFNHNLGKKPSISVEQEGSPGQVAMMPVKYINNNTVRVYFTGTTSGVIYAN
tara:strand:- start:1528 stop:2289 length:762 start_codon:yes stop_codon:yes gene_type:complete